ncbi:MAG: Wzz/FepE/Etk N-terminal domain-containing protein [Vicinamibacterales bacterium]
MEERSFHPLDYVSVLQRRKWWFIVPLSVAIFISAALAMFLPREYKSEAEIGIADPTLSPELLRGVQSFDERERQRAVQQLLSRSVLERVVREEGLNPNRPVEETAGALRSKVEQNITVPKPIGRGAGTKEGIESFRLGYVASTPERAQRIANRVAMVFVEENSKTKTQRAENTSEVLGQQLRDSQEKLGRVGEQLRVKKEAYMGRLPDQMNANIQMVNGLRSQLESLSMQLRGETERLSQIDSALDMMRQGVGSAAGLTATGAAAIQGTQSRINSLQRELVQFRAIGYTDRHPDIVRIKGELAEAEKESLLARESPASRDQILNSDPFYRRKIEERNETRLRISQLRVAESQARRQIGSYQARVEAGPMVQQELSSLEQDYNLELERYKWLSAQHQNAVMAENFARKQGGERFVVLNSAYLPTRPFSPDILELMAMALAIGLVLGAAAVVGREFLDRSVHDARALQTEFDVPVLGEIPRIHAAT